MTSRDDELQRFKTEINLSELAAAYGFDLDPRSTSPNSVAMKHTDGEKIILGMDGDVWVYFAVHGGHRGSVIDFVQARRGVNLGQVRKALRPWLDGYGGAHIPPRPTAARFVPRLEAVVVDPDAVLAQYSAAEDVRGDHPYLTPARGIPGAVLASERFLGRVRVDRYGAALFPHWNAERRLCGFEIKNRGFTGFAKGGTKGLWASHGDDQDQRMVVCETAIDALSVATLFGYERTRYFSIGGSMNPQQPGLLQRAICRMPTGGQVVLAVDHDDGGQQIIENIKPIFRQVRDTLGRGDLQLVVHQPDMPDADWNDILCGQPGVSGHGPGSPEDGP